MNISISFLPDANIVATVKINSYAMMDEAATLTSYIAKHVLAAAALNLVIGTSIGLPAAALCGASFYLGNRIVNSILKETLTRVAIREPAMQLCKAIMNDTREEFSQQLDRKDFFPNMTKQERSYAKNTLNYFKKVNTEQHIRDFTSLFLTGLINTRPEFQEIMTSFFDSGLLKAALDEQFAKTTNCYNNEIDSPDLPDILYFKLVQSPNAFIDNIALLSTKIIAIVSSASFLGVTTGISSFSFPKGYVLENVGNLLLDTSDRFYNYVKD